ncbi:MAG: Na+/H+ antiporter NhaC family protein [Bacteroidia bacterium]|nr:Na+/H+ antiporter NhaC family protein [Bacteroidia bacterium]
MQGVNHEVKLKYPGPWKFDDPQTWKLTVCGAQREVLFENGLAKFEIVLSDYAEFTLSEANFSKKITAIPLWLSIIPPLLAIIMALVFREVISSLFMGIFVGAVTIHMYLKGVLGIGSGLLAVLDTYILDAIADKDHVSVIVFSMLIGAMVAIISRNGGMQGVVDKISVIAKDARSGQLATWFLGVAIFFDDYANTLVVGNTMRPVTDRLKISREKLSYIVDSTAAPVAAIAFVTTWIGAELGYIKDGISTIGLSGDESPYSIFIGSLQFSFYPILTLAFMLMLILKNRDFGPMLKAENRARTTGQVSAEGGSGKKLDREKQQELDDLEPVTEVKPHWLNAFIPVMVVIVGTIIGLLYTGWDADKWADPALGFSRKISYIIGNANSYSALLWSSLCGVATAILLTLVQRIMNLEQSIEAAVSGFKTMLNAMLILIMAWALAHVTDHLHTADFITSGLESLGLAPWLLPALTFILAGAVSFSTGSSWGTMAILYPLMIPAAWTVSQESGLSYEESMMILYNVVSCVLAGSVLGDHCSPISDTTILSSLASSCNHIDHVRTQLPYALTVGGVGVLFGTIPGALGLPVWISLPLSLAVLYAIVHFVGKKVTPAGSNMNG